MAAAPELYTGVQGDFQRPCELAGFRGIFEGWAAKRRPTLTTTATTRKRVMSGKGEALVNGNVDADRELYRAVLRY